MTRKEMIQDTERSSRMTMIVTVAFTILLYFADHIA